jgi:hypothetical protein
MQGARFRGALQPTILAAVQEWLNPVLATRQQQAVSQQARKRHVVPFWRCRRNGKRRYFRRSRAFFGASFSAYGQSASSKRHRSAGTLMQTVQPARMLKVSAMLELLWEQSPRRLAALDAG